MLSPSTRTTLLTPRRPPRIIIPPLPLTLHLDRLRQLPPFHPRLHLLPLLVRRLVIIVDAPKSILEPALFEAGGFCRGVGGREGDGLDGDAAGFFVGAAFGFAGLGGGEGVAGHLFHFFETLRGRGAQYVV